MSFNLEYFFFFLLVPTLLTFINFFNFAGGNRLGAVSKKGDREASFGLA